MKTCFKQNCPIQKCQISDEDLAEAVRKFLQWNTIRRIFWICMDISFLIIFARYWQLFYSSIQDFHALCGFYEISFLWGGIITGILIGFICSIFWLQAITIVIRGIDVSRMLVIRVIAYYTRLQGISSQQKKALYPLENDDDKNQVSALTLRQYLKWQKEMVVFFGIPLRQNNVSDFMFIEQLQHKIPQKKQVWLSWGIILGIAPVLGVLEDFVLSWNSFVIGIHWGAVFFVLIEIMIVCFIFALRGSEFHRIEELFVEYYDMLKENVSL